MTTSGATAWRVVIKRSAAKELELAGRKTDRTRIVALITSLAADPRPTGCEKLSGKLDLYRIRSGSYRVVYEIEDRLVIVTVIRIAHRKDVYRQP